jgi:hypothetical protein
VPFRITKVPCEFTVPSQKPGVDRTTPFVIVSGNGTPFCPHLALLPRAGFATQLYSLDMPAYVPSNTVVVDPGACAATGIANARDAATTGISERMAITP